MIKLKPQLTLKNTSNGPLLIDEHQQVLEDMIFTDLLIKLVQGVDADSLSDLEFEQVEVLNTRGYITTSLATETPAWELCGVNPVTLKNQLEHLSIKVVDKTSNRVGKRVLTNLLKEGVIQGKSLELWFVEDYNDLPGNQVIPILPIMCNRMKLWLGPIQFEWSPSIKETLFKNPSLIETVNYSLPKVFDALQVAWLTAAIMQLIARSQLRYVDGLVCYDMTMLEQRVWL